MSGSGTTNKTPQGSSPAPANPPRSIFRNELGTQRGQPMLGRRTAPRAQAFGVDQQVMNAMAAVTQQLAQATEPEAAPQTAAPAPAATVPAAAPAAAQAPAPAEAAPAAAPAQQESPSIGPNQSQNRNGLPTLEDLAQFEGISPKELASMRHGSMRLMKLNSAISSFHKAMDKPIPIQKGMTKYNLADQRERENYFGADPAHFEALTNSLIGVINAVEALLNKPNKSALRLQSSLGNLLTRAHLLMPTIVNLPNVYATYVLETGKSKATGAELYASRYGKMLGSSMVNTGVDGGRAESAKLDVAAAQANNSNAGSTLLDQSMGNQERIQQLENEIKNRYIPTANAKNLDQELILIMKMIDDLELRTDLGETGRMHMRNRYSPLMTTFTRYLAVKQQAYSKDSPNVTERDRQNRQLAMDNMGVLCGKTVEQAMQALEAKMISRADENVILAGNTKGGNESTVYTDAANKRILRVNKERALEETKGLGSASLTGVDNMNLLNFQREMSFTPTIDEALSVVGKLLGFGNIAEASGKYFKTKDKETGMETLQYGSDMVFADGNEAKTISPDFGYTKADGSSLYSDMKTDESGKKTVKSGASGNKRREVFSAFDPQSENAKAVHEGLLQLQVIDFIVGHRDRHDGNFFINTSATTADKAVTGIDNDVAFGLQPGSRGQNAMNALSYREDEDRVRDSADQVSTKDFACVTQRVHDRVMALDLDALDRALRPFITQVARTAAVARAKKLKDVIANAKIVDLGTPEGMNTLKNYAEQRFIAQLLHSAAPQTFKGQEVQGKATASFSHSSRHVGQYTARWLALDTEFSSGALKSDAAKKDLIQAMLANAQAQGLSREDLWNLAFTAEEQRTAQNKKMRKIFIEHGIDQDYFTAV